MEQSKNGRSRKALRAVAAAAVAVGIGLGIGTLIWPTGAPAPRTVSGAALDVQPGDIVYGPAEASPILALVSLTCGHCSAWERDQMPILERGLVAAGRAKVVVRDFPLDHDALVAAALVQCLPPMRRPAAHRALLLHQDDWVHKGEAAMATVAGLTGQAATDAVVCAGRQEGQDAIVAAASAAQSRYGVKGTPTFVVGNQVMSGNIPATKLIEGIVAR